MFKYENNRMKIDNYVYDFKFEIRNVIQYNNNYYFLFHLIILKSIIYIA